MNRNDTWRFTLRDDAGNERRIVLKGTFDPRVAAKHAALIANAQRQRVIRDWGEEHAPTITVSAPEPAGDNSNVPPGHFRPPNAKPIDLDAYTRDVSERLGHGGERPDPADNAAARGAARIIQAKKPPAPTK